MQMPRMLERVSSATSNLLSVSSSIYNTNKLASLEATLVRNSAQRLSDGGEV